MSKMDKFVTVAELIEQLRQWPQDAYVLAEGCDCYGLVRGTSYPMRWDVGYDDVVVSLQGNPFVSEEAQETTIVQCVTINR